LSGEFKGNNVGDDEFPPSEDFEGTDEDFSPSEDFQGTNEDCEELPPRGDFKSSDHDYGNGGHSFLSGEFKGSNAGDDDFPPSEDFQGTDEDDEYFPPSEDFQGTNEDDEEFLSSEDFKSIDMIMLLEIWLKQKMKQMVKVVIDGNLDCLWKTEAGTQKLKHRRCNTNANCCNTNETQTLKHSVVTEMEHRS